jgi:hypothetical protein
LQATKPHENPSFVVHFIRTIVDHDAMYIPTRNDLNFKEQLLGLTLFRDRDSVIGGRERARPIGTHKDCTSAQRA